MNYLAITTCNAEQWEKHGRKMATTFYQNWPEEVPLFLYAEGFHDGSDVPNFMLDLDEEAPLLATFKATYNHPEHRGMVNSRYEYKLDAVKFAHKIAAIGAAAEECERGTLIWMDADIVTHAPVTVAWLEALFPPSSGAALAWLDRTYKEAECGFLMFRLPSALTIIRRLVKTYQDGSIFALEQTHDSFVIQNVVDKARQRGEITVHSLSRDKASYRHPFINSRLGECMDHLKGSRKEHGRSYEIDLKRPRPEVYWQ